ncbi:uncharacterized protein LOC143304132 [Bombus vancouverensis nearcticus]|uniref:uncharacterized protein LOC143304132 n=1 Tax=Bombus vancouverensis nearcticus TaxID=2705178 RepID=UPI00402BAD1C
MAQDLMCQNAIEARPDVVISEPYRQLPYWKDGLVGIGVGDILCFSGYCSPNIKIEEYMTYINKLASEIRKGVSRNKKVIVAGDFNAKSMCWGGQTTDKNGRTSCPDIISATNMVNDLHVRNKVLNAFTALDHLYISHTFKTRTKCMVETCDKILKKVSCTTNKKYSNHWWNETIAELRTQDHKALRKITRARRKEDSGIKALISNYKGLRRQLKKKIAGSKKRAWAGFCEILERDPWGKPYRTIMNRCGKKGLPNDMPVNKVKEILKGLFIIGRRSELREVEEHDREDITYNMKQLEDEDVKEIIGRINGKKAVGIDGVPGDIVKLLVNNRTELITKVINSITDSGRILGCCKTARVILPSKPGREPKLPNAYRPISVLPALRKVWEKCLKLIIERCMGVDSFHRGQYGKFGKHIASVCDKAGIKIGALRAILPNIKGPPRLARRLYYSVWESIIAYGAPVWADAMKYEKNKIIKRAQRTALCITSTAYRTVSLAALCVLTGNLPIYIKVRMLKGIYERKNIYKTLAVGEEVIERHAEKKEDLEEVKKKASTECQAE